MRGDSASGLAARLRLLLTQTGVYSSRGHSDRFTGSRAPEWRDTGLGMEGERNRPRGRQRITGCGIQKKIIHKQFTSLS